MFVFHYDAEKCENLTEKEVGLAYLLNFKNVWTVKQQTSDRFL